jgi:hypothetical protein
MKSIFVLAFSLMSVIANAGSVDAITSIVSIGNHAGTNENGECTITVEAVNYPAKAVMVTATDATGEFSKLVEDGSQYQSCMKGNCSGGKLFVQVDHVKVSADGSSYAEKILRTSRSGKHEGKLYVVVAERTVLNNDSTENKVECEIDL